MFFGEPVLFYQNTKTNFSVNAISWQVKKSSAGSNLIILLYNAGKTDSIVDCRNMFYMFTLFIQRIYCIRKIHWIVIDKSQPKDLHNWLWFVAYMISGLVIASMPSSVGISANASQNIFWVVTINVIAFTLLPYLLRDSKLEVKEVFFVRSHHIIGVAVKNCVFYVRKKQNVPQKIIAISLSRKVCTKFEEWLTTTMVRIQEKFHINLKP